MLTFSCRIYSITAVRPQYVLGLQCDIGLLCLLIKDWTHLSLSPYIHGSFTCSDPVLAKIQIWPELTFYSKHDNDISISTRPYSYGSVVETKVNLIRSQ